MKTLSICLPSSAAFLGISISLSVAPISNAQNESPVVGFYKLSLQSGVSLVGVPLLPFPSETAIIEASTNEIPAMLEDYFVDLRGGTDAGTADRVGLYEADSTEPVMLWKHSDGLFRDSDGQQCTALVTAGSGFWLEVRGSRQLTLTGELRSDRTQSIAVEAGVQILSIPLPAQLAVTDLDWAKMGAVAGPTPEQADQIGVYDKATSQIHWAWLSNSGWRWLSSGSPLSALDSQLSTAQGCAYVHRGKGFVLKF